MYVRMYVWAASKRLLTKINKLENGHEYENNTHKPLLL